MPDPAGVLVVAPNWLGDAVMALPAIADVRRHFRTARLVVAARASVAPLFAMVPGVDEVVTLQWRGQALKRAALAGDVEGLRAVRADVVILLPNSFASAWMAKQSGIAARWGYARDVRRLLLTRAIPRPAHSLHQGAYYQHLVCELGIESGPPEPIVEVPAAAIDAARQILRRATLADDEPFIVMAPGAAYGTAKRWLPSHFATLIASLAENGVGSHLKRTFAIVLVGGAADAETTRMIVGRLASEVRSRVADLTGRTSLTQLAGLLRLASACVSNDSGAMHVAGAVGTPLVALFGPTREYETAPLVRHGVERRLMINPVWCRPCMLRECPIDHRCMRGLTPDRVRAGVDEVLMADAR